MGLKCCYMFLISLVTLCSFAIGMSLVKNRTYISHINSPVEDFLEHQNSSDIVVYISSDNYLNPKVLQRNQGIITVNWEAVNYSFMKTIFKSMVEINKNPIFLIDSIFIENELLEKTHLV